jgi:hypothetical protein
MQLMMMVVLVIRGLRRRISETLGEASSAVLVDVLRSSDTSACGIFILRCGINLPTPVPMDSLEPSLAWQFGQSSEDGPFPGVP